MNKHLFTVLTILAFTCNCQYYENSDQDLKNDTTLIDSRELVKDSSTTTIHVNMVERLQNRTIELRTKDEIIDGLKEFKELNHLLPSIEHNPYYIQGDYFGDGITDMQLL